jgi:RNA polymerase sigma-70 factor (ECF subfamily)
MNFEETYTRLFKPVLAYIQSRLNNNSAAPEIAASVWQKVYEHQDQFDPAKGCPEQWIFTIARNEVNKYRRFWQFKRFFSLAEEEEQVPAPEKTPFEQLVHNEQNKMLLAALAQLNNRERDLLALKFYSGLNNRQIARLTALSESNVGTIVNRALAKLRKRLEAL